MGLISSIISAVSTKKARESQDASFNEAMKFQEDFNKYAKELNQPVQKIGAETLQNLNYLVNNNQFAVDDTMLDAYVPDVYKRPEYQSRFDNFRYDTQRPEMQQFNRDQYSEASRPEISRITTDQFNQTYNPQDYRGRDVMTDYGTYRGQEAPQMRQISNQFETGQFQQQDRRPDIYRAEEGPQANYYNPEKVEIEKNFRVEDDPGYQRRYQKAMEAIESSAAAQGMQLSGATLEALQEQAAQIASEETQAAYNRFSDTRDLEASKESEYQDRVQQAMQFQSTDEYQRYLDRQGIRKDEQQQLINQFERDREFGASQNKENWLREQASKQLGRELNDDEFNRWQAQEGQSYSRYADQRDWKTSQSNLAADRDWQEYSYEKGFGRDVYTQDRDYFQQNQENQAQRDMLRAQMQQGAYDTDIARRQQQYQWGSQFDADQLNQYQGQQQQQFVQDRDYWTNLAMQKEQNAQQQYQWGSQFDYQNMMNQNAVNYAQLADQYNRQQNANQLRYGQFSDLINMGQQANQNVLSYGQQAANQMGDLNIGMGNVNAAAQQQMGSTAANFLSPLSQVFKEIKTGY